MGFFDERVLAALKDGKPRRFTTLLGEVVFSHNTLHHHLERLMAKGVVFWEKVAANGFGRPAFAYHVPSRTAKQVTSALEDPAVKLVAICFQSFEACLQVLEARLRQRNKEGLCASNLPPQIRR